MKTNENKNTLLWIYRNTKKQFWPVILLVVLSAIAASIGTVTALLSRSAIDFAIDKQMDRFIFYAILLATIFIAHVFINAFCKYLLERCRSKIEISLKQKLFSAILNKNYSKISGYHSGELLNRLTGDVAVIGDAVATILPRLASMISRLVVAFSVIVLIEPIFALIFSALGIVIFISTRSLRRKIKNLHKEVQKTEDNTRSYWQEVMVNLLAIKVFDVQERMGNKSDQLQQLNFDKKMKKTVFGVIANTGYGLVLRAGYIFAFSWCGFSLLNSSMSFGTFTAVLQLISQIQQPFSGLSGIIPKYYGALASAERIMEIEDIENEKSNFQKIDANMIYNKTESIEFSDVSFAYDDENVLQSFDFSFRKGDFIAITGRSGIGKSTLFKLLLGVYSVNNGSIFIKMQDDQKIACDETTRLMFAYVPQGNLIFSGTILENLNFINPDADQKQIERALFLSCADEFTSKLPQGLETVIGEKGIGLSEGQVQRLAIARALLCGSPILLLDEATGSLDEATEAKILQNLKNMKNITCLIVTHRKQALNICNKHINIEKNID